MPSLNDPFRLKTISFVIQFIMRKLRTVSYRMENERCFVVQPDIAEEP